MKLALLDRIKSWFKKHIKAGENTSYNQPATNIQQPTTPNGQPSLKNRLSALVEDKVIPGMAISIYRGDQALVHCGFGYADLERKLPVHPGTTLFRAASVSKPITACALATLVAEGKLDLDASLYSYVPYFPEKKHDFTIRQLAAHTAGIRGYRGKEYALNKPYSIRDSLTVFQDDPLLFEPGTQFHYNSYDHVLLSLAIEEVTGRSFSDYTREMVLEPLNMFNTVPETPDNQTPPTTFYTRNRSGFQKAVAVDNRFKLAGGGYLTTTEDLIKLGQAILEERFYPKEMSTILEAQEIKGKSTYYGLGWEVSMDSKGRQYFGHIGNQVGGYSYFKIFPETGLVVAILVNCTAPKIQNLLDEVVEGFQNA